MTRTTVWLAMIALCAVGTVAQAHCGECDAKSDKAAVAATSATEQKADCDSCPIAAAMEKLPKITFAVGGEAACCENSAEALAKESGGHIHYVVGKQEFDSKADAHVALIEATEGFVASFTECHTCPHSGTVTLAGETQSCEKTAANLAKLMSEAMEEVKLTYAVGEEECSCPIEAGKLAEKSGAEKQFVVGEEKTCCEQTARLNLARAKYQAAVAALVEAQAPAKETAESAEEQGT
jgi:hypothetical protein